MLVAVLAIIVLFLIVATMLSRQSGKTKKQAIEDLKADKASVGTFDIFELVETEVTALGLLDVEGSQDVPHAVLLKVWRDSDDIVAACNGKEHLRYIVADGVKPADASEADVALECTKRNDA